MGELYFLRPWWFIAFIPLLLIILPRFRGSKRHTRILEQFCDPHFVQLLGARGAKNRSGPLLLLIAGSLAIIALAGPAIVKTTAPVFKAIFPHVVLLDMSEAMQDVTPDRLTRAKFKLHELFRHRDNGQFALIAYTAEPFIVSPLTDDADTIDALLPSITGDIMPVYGHNLANALAEARRIIEDAGNHEGAVLVLTANFPDEAALSMAKSLNHHHIYTSVIPFSADNPALFKKLAMAGYGSFIPLTDDKSDVNTWLAQSKEHFMAEHQQESNVPLWRDDGRYFIIPALLLLLPLFRRGWLTRILA